jgi:Rrf2 family protein
MIRKNSRGEEKMQISSRFTLAVHIFTCIDTFQNEYKVTSDFIASSTNVNPVIIRKILLRLKAAGLVQVARGTGGTTITRPLSEITFLDIYRAVECVEDNKLFHFHENPNPQCPVGKNIHNILDDKLQRVQDAMERELQAITLEDVKEDLEKYLQQQN